MPAPQAGAPATARASECAQAGERRQRSDLRACSGPRWHPMLCLLQANLDPAHTRWLPDPTHPASRPPSGQAGVGRARLAARPPAWGCWSRAWHNGGTGGFRSFVAFVREADTAVVVLSNTARSVGRLGLAPAQGAGQRRRPGRWLITVETGSRRRRGLARGSAPAAGRSTGPG
jgi:CubicO group peptidase (beta-lactamase class C family)